VGYGPSAIARAEVPAPYLRLYVQAGARYGIDPWILAGIGAVETDHGRSTALGVRSGVNAFGCCANVIHLLIGGARVKSLRSHLSGGDLAQLARDGATPAGPPPLPPPERDAIAIEVDRTVNNVGTVSLTGRQVTAGEAFRGRRLTIRIESATLVFLDPSTRELLRTRPNLLTSAEVRTLQGARPARPPPRPRAEPVTVQRRVSATGVITVCRQPVALGRVHAGRIVSVHVSEHTLAIELGDDTRTVRRTTTRPVVAIKGSRRRNPARATSTQLSGRPDPETTHPQQNRS
jgi:hypothetical protein